MIARNRFDAACSCSGQFRGRDPVRCRRRAAAPAVCAAALLGCVLTGTGCKTGTTFAKPSWWTFGGGPKAEADALASAPPYGGDIKKPSESAKPYPTTSTPNGYVMAGTAPPADTPSQAIPAAVAQAPVVYGTTRPPVAAAPAAPTATAAVSTPPSSAIAPQVGPYSSAGASVGGDQIPPPGQPLPPIAPSMPSPMPSMAGGPGMAATTPPPVAADVGTPAAGYSSFQSPSAAASPPPRLADSRASDPAAAIPAAALPVEPAAVGGSRYSSAAGSRFSAGGEAASFSPAVAVPPPAYDRPAESMLPPAAPPAGVSPGVMPATPGLLQPSPGPVRRPDPGYRPGGTSSYRPSRVILADDAAPASNTVRTAAYEEAAGGSVLQ